MSFIKKLWKDRVSEYPNRRTINDGYTTKRVTVGRDEGNISEEGTPFNAANMNDLEDRIYAAIEQGGGGGGGSGTYDYDELMNKPTINSVQLAGNKTTADLHISYNDLEDTPNLANVAETGDYNDLINTPTIPMVKSDTLSNCTTDAVGMVTNYYPSMTNCVILNAVKLRTVGTSDYAWVTYMPNSTDANYILLVKSRDGTAYANQSGFSIKYWYMDI